jgi:hypothetical protein
MSSLRTTLTDLGAWPVRRCSKALDARPICRAMVNVDLSIPVLPWWFLLSRTTASEKKADVVEHREAFDHVGLLVNEPSGTAGLPFI